MLVTNASVGRVCSCHHARPTSTRNSFSKKTTIGITQDNENGWTQLDIKTLDRPGLLASMCKIFTENKLSIKKASISTYGETAEDRFCVVTDKDSKLENEDKLAELTDLLLQNLSGEDCE